MRRVLLLFVTVSFILTSCSEERIQDISTEQFRVEQEGITSLDFVKSNEKLTSNFLPTFTNYYGRDIGTSTNRSSSVASEWIHEYDENDKLIKSSFYELFPYRILKEVTYLSIGEDQKLSYEIKNYSYYSIISSVTNSYELILNNDLYIERIIPDEGRIAVFKELNDQGWVTTIHTVAPNNSILYKSGYEYDETGNVLKYLAYDAPGVASSIVDYTYNENGDPLSYHFQNTAGAESKAEYYYRPDNTLERLEEEYYYDVDDFGSKTFIYNLEERFSKKILKNGDGSNIIVAYSADEIIEEHFGNDDLLSEVYFYQIRESGYFLKKHEEYFDGVIHEIKYYDDNGELDYTEYYDENGNLSDTIYE